MLRKSLLLICVFVFTTSISFAGTLIDDFEDGDINGWERSPQNGDNENVFWGLSEGAMMFDLQGEDWAVGISQMNFVGTPQVPNVREWTNYEFELDIKHMEFGNHPGGIRVRVDLDTGGHYALWLYPANSNMKLYKNPGWDINTGLSELGSGAYEPDTEKYHKLKIKCEGDNITVYYDDDEIISANDNEHKAGTIALCVQNKIVYFDNIKVTGAQIPNVEMSPVEPAGKLTATWGAIK